MPPLQIHFPKVVEHRLSAAVPDLVVQCSEVSTIATLYSTDSECSVTPLVASCRNDPARFGEHYDMEKIAHLECVNALALYGELRLGNHCLEPSDAPFVATPI